MLIYGPKSLFSLPGLSVIYFKTRHPTPNPLLPNWWLTVPDITDTRALIYICYLVNVSIRSCSQIGSISVTAVILSDWCGYGVGAILMPLPLSKWAKCTFPHCEIVLVCGFAATKLTWRLQESSQHSRVWDNLLFLSSCCVWSIKISNYKSIEL